MKHLLTFSTCLLLMLCSIVSYANLDDNFIYLGEHNNSTYYCSNTSDFTWHEARVAAQTYGGHLAIVDDAAENEFIRNSIMSDYIWLGLTDENSEGNYYDVFGNSCQYYNWNAGEPNNSNGEEHFVRLLKSNGQWTDRNASFLAEFVVEIPNAPTAPTPTGNVCTTRSANNVINCNNDLNYGGWLKIAGYTTSYNVSNANLVEYSDGTAVFTGTWTNHDDNNLVFDFEIWASGKTDVAPANSPKTHSCLTPDYNEFYYYTDFDGILYGKNFAEGAQIVIATYGAAFQLGVGANATGTENTFGASAWYSGYLTQQPTNGNSITLNTSANGHLGDINIQLSGGVDDCDNPPTCDGEISSIMLTNGSESVTLENGGTYQICELPTDNYLEAVVNGSHESFKFTVNGVDRTENSEPYNYPSVSNGETWNPQPDTYTIVSQLYAENNLGGLLCNEETIQITIEDCSPCYQLGGDSDNDGICDNDDCAPNNADLPTTPGTACDDNNNNTITDVIQADACTCAGTVPTNVCVKYKVSDSTPECGPFPNEAGVFFRRDCPSPTFEVWKAGDDLMLEERGDGTAVLTGSVYNGAIIGIVNIEYWAYSSTGTNWTNTCYNDQMNEDYFYNHFEGTISIDGIEYTLVEKGASFVFGEGANNESTGEFGFGGWLDGTWGNCVESFGKLTPIVPGSTCDDGNPETENDVIGADGCTCAGIVDPCILDELVTVSYEDLLCENTGAITFNFVDESDRTQIAFSLDGGSTWKSNIQDNLGSVTYADLVAGTYELMTRWGNGDCPTTLESVVIQGNGASPVATVSSTDTNCGGSDGSITFTFENAPNRSQIAFSLDGGSTWEANVADNSGSKIYENLAEGTYDLSIRWGDTDCPTSLGQVTLSYGNIGTTCDDGDACTTGDVYDAACNCVGTFADADNDGVCDANDICEGSDDTADADGDGTPDGCDDCDAALEGTTCNDGDDCTTGDVYDAACNCAGTFADADNDGVCDADDCAPNNADLPTTVGTACNDNDPTTENDVIQSNGCDCAGTEIIIPGISIDDVIVSEQDGTAVLNICLDEATTVDVTVDFATANDSALEDADYLGQSGTITIEAGELCAMVIIELVDDANPEDTEELVVNLSNPTGAELVDDQGTVTILDTDVIVPSISIDDVIVNEEDGTAVLTICSDVTSIGLIVVDFTTSNGSAIDGVDYAEQSGIAVIPSGELCTMITIDIIDDASPESTEELVVNLSNVIGAVIADDQGTITILDTDATPLPSLDINDITVNEEDGIATLEICLDAVSDEAITVDFATADDSANEGSDYTGISGTLTIEAGELCAAITIPLVDDATPEETEELVVNLSNPIGAVIADDQGTVTILDTDVEASNCDDITITEADGTITTAGYDSPIVFIKVYDSNWNNVFDSGMITDNDAQSVSGLPAGEYWVFVKAYDMSWNELCDIHETITIEGVIGNDPNLAINDITVNEEDGTATLEVCLDEVSDEAITVDFATADDSANEGSDYTGVSGTLTIEAGELCAAITIPLVDDATPESTEELVINLSNPTGANLADDQGVITILDTDVLGNDPLIAINDITINEEDGLATLAICLDAIADEDVTVDYATTNGSAIAGDDYIASTGTVTIPAGMLCMIIDLPILDDNNPESTETFEVILSNPNGGSIYDGTGIVTILDTDTPADGCSAISIEANDAVITVGGYSDPIVFVKVYDGNWDLVYNSGMLTNNETQTITVTETDTYWVFVKTYDTNWNQLCDKHEVFNVICHGADLCADLGGDTDGDGVCDDNDLCPGFDDNIDTNNNGIPDACDTVDPELCIEREVSSTDLCVGDTDYSFFIRFENTHYYYQFTDAATFTEYTDGTALLTGTIQNNEIPSLQFEVEVLYSGRTIDAPAESPKEHVCLSVDTDMFYFYPSLTGTLTGIDGAEGAVITMTEFGPAFQVGLGGNVTSTTDDFGGSGWMTMEVVNQPTTGSPLSFESSTSGEGDVNIMLTGGYEECLDVAITAPTTGGTENSSCNVEITSGDGTLSIGGYTQPVAIIQVFDNQWTPVFSCMGDCANPLVIDDLETGTYFVKVSLYDENWIMECGETEGYYGVVNSLGLETQGAEFLFFTAAKDGNDVTLNWTTNTEYKNDYFVVERSIDGLNFETAFDVSSIRDNDAAVYYTDKDASPLRGKSFYRLKQVYDNGTYRYSNIKPIEFELGLLDFTVYPNPTTDKVFINLKEFEGEAASVVINNALGAEMMTFNTEALTRDAIEFNVSDLQAGMYSITAKMEGRKQLTRLFVIAKK